MKKNEAKVKMPWTLVSTQMLADSWNVHRSYMRRLLTALGVQPIRIARRCLRWRYEEAVQALNDYLEGSTNGKS